MLNEYEDTFPNISRRAELFESNVTRTFPFIYSIKSKNFEIAKNLYHFKEHND